MDNKQEYFGATSVKRKHSYGLGTSTKWEESAINLSMPTAMTV